MITGAMVQAGSMDKAQPINRTFHLNREIFSENVI
jgi:hypothetical protein